MTIAVTQRIRRRCLSYVIVQDPGDSRALWITEVWTDEARFITEPAGGHGLGLAQTP